jgi:hypothetical protein
MVTRDALSLVVALSALWAGCALDLDQRAPPGLDDRRRDTMVMLQDAPSREPGTKPPDLAIDQSSPDKVAPPPPGDRDNDNLPDDVDPDPDKKNKIYYYQKVGTNIGDFKVDELLGPSLSVKGTDYCQTSLFGGFEATLNSAPASNDYVIATAFTLTWGGWSNDSHAGIDFRFNGSGYQCRVHFQQRELQLVSGNWAAWASIAKGAPANAAGSFRLIVRAVGNKLDCTLESQHATVSATDGTFKSGSVGIAAREANPCFQYLIVASIPP